MGLGFASDCCYYTFYFQERGIGGGSSTVVACPMY